MKHWTRGRRERSTLAVAWAAYSTGGARDKGPRYCDRGCSSTDHGGGKRVGISLERNYLDAMLFSVSG